MRGFFWVPLLCSGLSCAGGSISIPLFDEAPLFQAHPEIARQVITADQYQEPSSTTEGADWVEEGDRTLAQGDSVRIRVEGQPELTRFLSVLPNGRIDYPGSSSIPAAGRTTAQVREEIRGVLLRNFKDPQVRLELPRREEPAPVDITGMVNHPSAPLFRIPPWLSASVNSANGYSRLANLAQIIIVRPKERIAIVCDQLAFLEDEDRSQNPRVLPDDVVIVTELYPETVGYAREWDSIADFLQGRISRAELVSAIRNLPAPPWKTVR